MSNAMIGGSYRRWGAIVLGGWLLWQGLPVSSQELQPQELQPQEPQVVVERFEVTGPNPLSESQLRAVLAPFERELVGLEALQAAAAALERALREAGYGFHQVRLPPQTIRDGTIQLQILPLTIGEVSVSGNASHSDENILQGLPSLGTGQTPDTRALGRDLELTNENPSKDVKVRFRDLYRNNEIGAEVQVEDRTPREYFTWFNNTGTRDSEDTRLGVGYRNSNLWDRDHDLVVTYTTSPEGFSDVKQYGLIYGIPLYSWSAKLTLLALHSDVDSGRVAGAFDVSGKGTVLGARFSYLLPRRRSYRHELQVSVLDKKFDDDTQFLGQGLGPTRPDVRSRPLGLEYQGNWQGASTRLGFHVRPVVNLPGGPDNDNDAYRGNRFGADANWSALRYGLGLDYGISRWLLRVGLDGQYADEPLISGEQFGLGGMFSVRGFEEREVIGDRGYRYSFEVLSPPAWFNVRAVGFYEGGGVNREQALPGESDNEDIASTGLGLRWAWREYLQLRVDYGLVLHGLSSSAPSGSTHAGDSKLHFNVTARF